MKDNIMGFYKQLKKYDDLDFDQYFQSVTTEEIQSILKKESINNIDFLKLLSPKAGECIEEMAKRAQTLSLRHFGKGVVLYTPIYISNYCNNLCRYCSFNLEHEITRRRLSYDEIHKEAQIIAKTGLKHVLVLTGSSREASAISYIEKSVEILKEYFESVAIEIYPLQRFEYEQLIKAGVDGLTIYQEVYDQGVYNHVHMRGPKKDYMNRLDAPERGCQAGMAHVNIGALLGLSDVKREVFLLGEHGQYLSRKYPEVALGFSMPRLKEAKGADKFGEVDDFTFVQMMLALRIYLPHFSMNISTRENHDFRKQLLPLGINKMSAGVSTAVGGHQDKEATSQFEIDDHESVQGIKEMIEKAGYQPVLKDWFKI